MMAQDWIEVLIYGIYGDFPRLIMSKISDVLASFIQRDFADDTAEDCIIVRPFFQSNSLIRKCCLVTLDLGEIETCYITLRKSGNEIKKPVYPYARAEKLAIKTARAIWLLLKKDYEVLVKVSYSAYSEGDGHFVCRAKKMRIPKE